MRPFRRHLRAGPACALVAAVVAVALLAIAAVQTARGSIAAGIVSADCPSLRNVKALKGTVTLALGATATGSDPSSSGSETVYLSSAAKHVVVNLDKKNATSFNGIGLVDVFGVAKGGQITVDDSYENTGLDLQGEVKASGSVGTVSIGGEAEIVIDRTHCEYKLEVAFQGQGTFSGDNQALDGTAVSWGAQSDAHPVPANLHFHGGETPKVMPKCPQLLDASVEGCADIGGPWLVDLIELDECGSIDLTNCTPNDEKALASAATTFTWTLHPVFKKKA